MSSDENGYESSLPLTAKDFVPLPDDPERLKEIVTEFENDRPPLEDHKPVEQKLVCSQPCRLRKRFEACRRESMGAWLAWVDVGRW